MSFYELTNTIEIKIVNDEVITDNDIPQYQTDGSVGLDLLAAIKVPEFIKPRSRVLIPTGIAININDNNVGAFIFARSGLASKSGIALSNGVGVIDSDYQGELKISITNNDPEKIFLLRPKDRIAQLVFLPVKKIKFNLVEKFSTKTFRSENGFGSTGI